MILGAPLRSYSEFLDYISKNSFRASLSPVIELHFQANKLFHEDSTLASLFHELTVPFICVQVLCVHPSTKLVGQIRIRLITEH